MRPAWLFKFQAITPHRPESRDDRHTISLIVVTDMFEDTFLASSIGSVLLHAADGAEDRARDGKPRTSGIEHRAPNIKHRWKGHGAMTTMLATCP